MVLLRPVNNKYGYELLEEGEFHELIYRLNGITEDKESIGELCVGDEWVSEYTIMRYFATKKDGLVDTLIICGGIASSIR